MNINNNIGRLKTSLIRQVLQKCNERVDSINLTIGEPDIGTPKIISERAAEYLLNNQISYSPLGGIPELREEIVSFYNEKYGGRYHRDEVLVTIGATEAISTSLRGIVNPGDEVVVVKPAYPLYEALLSLLGARIVYVDTKENNYRLNGKILSQAVNEKTKAVIINYPSNPCGTLLTEEEVREIGEVIEKNNCYLISDEIYSELVFRGEKFISMASVEGIEDKVIVINGFSKSHSMTGWRLGYLLTEKKLRDQLMKVSQYTVSSAPTLAQYGGVVALQEVKDVKKTIDIYEKRVAYLYDILTDLGFEVVKPQGTFYIFGDYSAISGLGSFDFTMKLLEETGVAVVPGEAFGVEKTIRISYTQELEVLKKAGERLKKYLTKNH